MHNNKYKWICKYIFYLKMKKGLYGPLFPHQTHSISEFNNIINHDKIKQ